LKSLIKLGGIALVLASAMASISTAQAEETIVFVRHGEKPANDSGQLTCKGLNRALALPDVLLTRYGKPEAIFAAGPKEDKLGSSLRPLTTITPTAIRLSMPINIQFHADDISGVQKALLSDTYRNSLVFVSWEHKNLDKLVKSIMKTEGADPDTVPAWPGSDFDSIFVLKINQQSATNKISFQHEAENLTTLSEQCPGAKS